MLVRPGEKTAAISPASTHSIQHRGGPGLGVRLDTRPDAKGGLASMNRSSIQFRPLVPVQPARVVQAYHSLLTAVSGEGRDRRTATASLIARLIQALCDARDEQSELVRQALDDARATLRDGTFGPG